MHLPRLGEDPGGLVELAGTEQHLAQRLGDVGEIGLIDGAGLGLAGGIQRPSIEARRLRGDGEITRSVAGQPTVDPRLVEPSRQVRMQGQRLGLLLHAPGFAFEVVDRRDVQRPTEPERQSFVGRIAQQRPTEPDVAVALLLEELREALPGGGVGLRRVVVEDPAERLDGHADAQHRRAADQGAVLRRQAIDPSHRRRLHRIRQPLGPARGGGGQHQVMQELGVAARSFHHRRQRMGWQRVQFGDGATELHRPLGRQGLGFDDHGVGRDVVREPLRPRTPADAEEPGAPVEMIGDVAQQVGRRVVHVVDVFDLDQRRLVQDPIEERGDRFVQPGAQELLAQHLDLLRRGDLDTERPSDEWQPREQLGIGVRDGGIQPVEHDVVGVVVPDVEQLPQQFSPHHVGRGRGVGLARGPQQDQPFGAATDLFEQSRLADPGLPDDLHEAPFPGAGLLERGVEHRHLGVPAHEREPFQRRFARS